MKSRESRGVLTGAVAAVLVLLVSGCQDSPDAGAATGPGTSTPGPSPSESPSLPEPTPTVEPAKGVLIDVPGATMRGLKTYRRIADFGLVQGYGNGQSDIILAPNLTKARSLNAFRKDFMKGYRGEGVTTQLDDAVVGGAYNAWHMLDEQDPLVENHIYGVMYLDGAWTIEISFENDGDPRPLTQAERAEVTSSLLATFEPHRETL
ncbi:MAG: hypothetical protein LH477_09105 [Nocardioides sp.]|nr:hypothetical protein [Nocardioides sp.]